MNANENIVSKIAFTKHKKKLSVFYIDIQYNSSYIRMKG